MDLPHQFIERTKALLKEEFPAFGNALLQPAPTSVRVNNKMIYEPSDERVPWCNAGYYLKERPLFTADPLFHAGIYYVQEASSMFLSQAVIQYFSNARSVLDLCAAPGGKSTLLSQFLSDDCILVSNEIIRSRAYILAENLIKWGSTDTIVSNNHPADFACLPDYFDAVVVDAPCSGEGLFRKDPAAVSEWSEANVKMCADRQKGIIRDVWDSLKPGGIMVYSTCTYNRDENENNVEWICNEYDAELLRVDLSGNKDIAESDFGYRFFPHRTRGEGFFMSVVRKKGNLNRSKEFKTDKKKGIKFVNPSGLLYRLNNSKERIFINDNNYIRAYSSDRLNEFLYLTKNLKCIESGVLVAEVKGSDLIPAAQLALSKALERDNIQTAEVDYYTAIAFLKKESIFLPDCSFGYVLILYKNQALGWVKNLGNRTNNLYPNNWRIRMNL